MSNVFYPKKKTKTTKIEQQQQKKKHVLVILEKKSFKKDKKLHHANKIKVFFFSKIRRTIKKKGTHVFGLPWSWNRRRQIGIPRFSDNVI